MNRVDIPSGEPRATLWKFVTIKTVSHDVIDIKFGKSKTGKWNKAYIHYIIKAQPLEVERPKRVKYSDFRLNVLKETSRISLVEVSSTAHICWYMLLFLKFYPKQHSMSCKT